MPIPRVSLFLDFIMYISTLVLVILLNNVKDSISENAESTESADITTDITDIDDITETLNSADVTTDTANLDYTTETPPQIWPNHTVYYSISTKFSSIHLQKLGRVLDFIEERTCIKFKAPSKEQKQKYYLFISGVGECSSQYGWKNAGRQTLVLNKDLSEGCFVYGKLLELLLRTLGYEGLSSHDITRARLGLRKKHIQKLNKMYHCFGGWEKRSKKSIN